MYAIVLLSRPGGSSNAGYRIASLDVRCQVTNRPTMFERSKWNHWFQCVLLTSVMASCETLIYLVVNTSLPYSLAPTDEGTIDVWQLAISQLVLDERWDRRSLLENQARKSPESSAFRCLPSSHLTRFRVALIYRPATMSVPPSLRCEIKAIVDNA